jgi:hypothetical protein
MRGASSGIPLCGMLDAVIVAAAALLAGRGAFYLVGLLVGAY